MTDAKTSAREAVGGTSARQEPRPPGKRREVVHLTWQAGRFTPLPELRAVPDQENSSDHAAEFEKKSDIARSLGRSITCIPLRRGIVPP